MVPDQLLLQAAFRRDSGVLDSWAAWARGRELDTVDPVEARLFSAVYRNLRDAGMADSEIPPLVKKAARSTWILTRLLVREALATSSLLASSGTRSLLLKGAALVAGGYHEAGVRPMADFDLLVRYEDMQDASAVLAANGWVAATPLIKSVLDSRHALVFRRGESTCDLHWWALWESRDAGIDDRFWSAAECVTFDGMTASILRPEHQLIHIVVHGSRAFDPSGVRWIGDAVAVLWARGGDFNWQVLVQEVEARRIEYPVGQALAYLTEHFGAAVPADVLAWMRSRNVPLGQRSMYVIPPAERPDRYAYLYASGYIWIHALSGMKFFTRLLWLPRNLQQAFGLSELRQLPMEIARRSVKRLGAGVNAKGSGRGA